MALEPYQAELYMSTMRIFRGSRTVGALGLVGDTTWSLIASNVPCHVTSRQNQNVAQGIGRVNQMSSITQDQVHCEVTVDLRADDLVIIDTPAALAGAVQRILGQPRKFPVAGQRRANKQTAELILEERPPAGVV